MSSIARPTLYRSHLLSRYSWNGFRHQPNELIFALAYHLAKLSHLDRPFLKGVGHVQLQDPHPIVLTAYHGVHGMNSNISPFG